MSKTGLRQELQREIERVEQRMREARARLDSPAARAVHKVEAAGDLGALEQRHRELAERLAALEREPDTAWEQARTALETETATITQALERWFDRYKI